MKPAALALVLAAAACGGSSAGKGASAGQGGAGQGGGPRAPVEDEVDDGMELEADRGRMEPAAIEAGIAPHKEGLTDCYMSRVSGRRWLGGRVSLLWEIAGDGTLIAVKLAESDLGAWAIERCLLEIARTATFGKPIGNAPAAFTLPLDFSPTKRSAVWDEDQALRAVGGQVFKLDACAKAKGVKGPLPDDVTVTLYVGAQGKAQSVGFASPASVLEDAWVECAEKAALAWRLPDPGGEIAKLAVRYRVGGAASP